MAIKARGKGGQLSLYKRVPARYAPIEPRRFVWLALHTDSRAHAERKAVTVWAEMVEAWEAKLAGDSQDAEQRFEAARNLAAMRGFRFLPVERVAQVPLHELRDRLEAVQVRDGKPDMIEAQAVLGGAQEPALTITGALDAYWSLAREKTLGKSEDQLRRWRNPRIKAIRNLVGVIGDKALVEVSADDMLDFRSWWLDRIEAGEVSAGSANKDLIHMGDMLKTVNRLKRLGLALPLDGLAFKEGEAGQCPPFSPSWIKDTLLAPGALDGLNSEARGILLAMVNTCEALGVDHLYCSTEFFILRSREQGRNIAGLVAWFQRKVRASALDRPFASVTTAVLSCSDGTSSVYVPSCECHRRRSAQRRSQKNLENSETYKKFTKSAKSTGPENIGPKRPLSALLPPGAAHGPARITIENKRKFRPLLDRENAFARASGGGGGADVEPSPISAALAAWRSHCQRDGFAFYC